MSDLPDGTEYVRVLYSSISVRLSPDDVPEDVEAREIQHTRSDSVQAVFQEGDNLPCDVAERCWSAFNDRLAAYDEDGNRLDTPSRNEEQGFDTALFHH
jgi:hypothetical protein